MWRRFLKFDGNAGKPVKDEYVGVKHPADEVAESLLRGRRVKRA